MLTVKKEIDSLRWKEKKKRQTRSYKDKAETEIQTLTSICVTSVVLNSLYR